jgi:uncharacterized protein
MLYLDTSILVPLFIHERSTSDVKELLGRLPANKLTTSDWTRVEFSSALARDVRMGILDSRQATEADEEFESLLARTFVTLLPSAYDYALAKLYLLRHEAKLRAADAFHLAIASNRHAEMIYSLDQGMVAAGRALGLPMYPYKPK